MPISEQEMAHNLCMWIGFLEPTHQPVGASPRNLTNTPHDTEAPKLGNLKVRRHSVPNKLVGPARSPDGCRANQAHEPISRSHSLAAVSSSRARALSQTKPQAPTHTVLGAHVCGFANCMRVNARLWSAGNGVSLLSLCRRRCQGLMELVERIPFGARLGAPYAGASHTSRSPARLEVPSTGTQCQCDRSYLFNRLDAEQPERVRGHATSTEKRGPAI